ncbi:MAG: DegV family protein [Bacilli bacterium]|nr:DegV family protein [Bacilli bacterium]
MSKFAIIGDSTCDLTDELRKEYDIDYCRMMVSWTNKEGVNKEIYASLSWEEISHKDYFDLVASGIRVFTTQVTEQEFDKVFEKHLKAGEDLLYIGCSSALSASVLLGQKLQKKYQDKYPDRKIYILDPLNSCMGQGSMLLLASEMRKDGKSIEEIYNYIDEHKLEWHQLATVENLDTLKRAGRVKASKAFFGNLFGVKPILISDAKGNNYAIEKQKGRRNALLRMVEMAKAEAVNPENQICWISDAECKKEDLELLVDNLKSVVKFKDVKVVPMGPIIGATTGKGTIGVFFRGEKVTIIGE